MTNWIENAGGSIGSWLGSGIGSFVKWLFGGLITVLEKVIEAADTFWDVLTSIWDFGVGFVTNIFDLFCVFFPFVPAPVMTVISLGLLAVLIAGIVKKARNA